MYRSLYRRLYFFLGLYFLVRVPSALMMPAATSDSRIWREVIARVLTTTTPYLPIGLRFRVPLLPVATVWLDVPDCEDVFWVPDADLDVRFFIDPTPAPNSLGGCCRNVNGAGG